jgi:hypothetical protein
MAEYPNPKDIDARTILKVAEQFLNRSNYGAAQYYAGFAIGLASYGENLIEQDSPNAPSREDLQEYYDKARKIADIAVSYIRQDLTVKLEGSNVTIHPGNEKMLFEEHSGHYNRMQKLLHTLGRDYEIPENTKIF